MVLLFYYEILKKENINGRRYFYPLISNFPTYKGLPSANKSNLPVASRVAQEVICLPMYADLEKNIIEKIAKILKNN